MKEEGSPFFRAAFEADVTSQYLFSDQFHRVGTDPAGSALARASQGEDRWADLIVYLTPVANPVLDRFRAACQSILDGLTPVRGFQDKYLKMFERNCFSFLTGRLYALEYGLSGCGGGIGQGSVQGLLVWFGGVKL